MARIRTIKPEFWSSGQVLECSPNARLLFLGMLNFADDEGRIQNSPKSLKAQIFPADPFTIADIEGMIVELSANDLVMPYEVDGKRYLQITGWKKHQRIDKPQPPKHPPPPEHSPSVRRTFPPDRIGRDRSREEGKERKKDAAPNGAHSDELDLGRAEPSVDPPRASDAETDLFRRGKEVLGDKAGGMIAQLLRAKDRNIALARAAIEQASTKQNPREYIGAIIKGQQPGGDDRTPRVMV
jgi:hypothetical protein